MKIKIGKKVWVFGKEPVRVVKANNWAVKALEQDCDPIPLIDLYKRFEWWSEVKTEAYTVAMNGVEAMLAAGREDAVIAMAELDLPLQTADVGRCYWYLALSRAHTQLERWEEAIREQNQAMDMAKGLNEQDHRGIFWYLALNGYTLRLHSGQMEGLEENCQALLVSAATPRDTMEAHFLLGQLYLTTKQAEQAKTHLTYVAEKGNKLLIQKQAQLLLAQLEGSPYTVEQLLFAAGRAADQKQHRLAADLYAQALALSEGQTEDKRSEIRLSHARQLINLGRFEEALEQLEQIKLPQDWTRQMGLQIDILYGKAIIYTNLNRLEEATKAQNQAVAAFAQGDWEGYRQPLCRSGALLKIKRGELDGLEEETEQILKNAHAEWDKMVAHMVRATYLLAAGRSQEAKPYLEYVVSHAGEHRYGQEAQAVLEAL